jgi:hypothetical protein
VAADGRFDGIRLGRLVSRQRPVRHGEGGEAVERNDRIAVRARHLLVDLGDEHLRRARRGHGGIGGRADRAVAVLVGRGELQQRRVERDAPAGEEQRDIGEEDRREVGLAGIDRLTHRRPGEE